MLLIKNGYIKTMAGEDIKNGCILIDDNGKIAKLGEQIEVPSNAQIIDAEGRLVTPGCVEAHCHVGMGDLAGGDYNETSSAITPEMRAIDGINPQHEAFANALRGGVTSVCTGPGSANVIGGTFAAIKCYGKRVDDMIIKDPIAMKCAFGENPKRIHGQNGKAPKTRMGTAALLREFLYKAKKYYEDKNSDTPPAFDFKLEAMIPVMAREIPLKAHAHKANDIFTSIRIAKEFGLKLTLDHCTDGALIADELAKEGYPAFVGPTMGGISKYELLNKSFDTPARLREAGVDIAIITDAGVIQIQYLPLVAGMAARSGLPIDEAWKAITINAANLTGIGDRVGSLEFGKDGDLVIWQADPLREIGAESHMTIIDGKVVYRAEQN
ncbi:MAG: amidohydrolase [Ruminococcaceae bacterium]|nr:amidohydrolase [Oscillospiraceae bacterium]